MSTSGAVLPSKKRKASHDSAANAASADRPADRPRKESEAGSSNASDDTTTMAFRAILDGASIGGDSYKTPMIPPLKKRKASFEGLASNERKTSFEGLASNERKTSFEGLASNERKASFDMSFMGRSSGERKASFDMSFMSSSDGPLRKRKMSYEQRPRLASLGSLDDAALGLGPLESMMNSSHASLGLGPMESMMSASHASDEKEGAAMMPHAESLAAMDHLDALGDGASMSGSKIKLHASGAKDEDSQASSTSNTLANGDRQLLIEALMGNSLKRRDRIESWGGMSDISLTMGGSGMSAFGENNPLIGDEVVAVAEIAAAALQRPFLLEHESDASSVSDTDKPVPSKISLNPRERFYSIASLGEPSVNGQYEIGPDLQKFVQEAMNSVGDQLSELAGVVETVAGSAQSTGSDLLKDILRDDHSGVFSTASSLPEIQAQLQAQLLEDMGRPRSMSNSSNPLSVDYDAVLAAVDAAEAATGAFDLGHFASAGRPKPDGTSSSLLPPIPPLPASSKSERDMDAMRARARAAAGYIPPASLKPGEVPPPSAKRRPKPATPHHKAIYNKPKHHAYIPEHAYSMYHAANKASSQKWDEMYECLLEFVEDNVVDTRGMSEKERKEVEWDGNVPTTYRTKDGKALGRWINNQRSAKHKGSLKKDREVKLMSTGLKWSVLSTNSWQDMMEELHVYVSEKTKDGGDWDGNVPTNYKIKGSTDEDGEERNLGRWINRQRSLYQSGKLRKDREAELEQIGLKWSVLSTTSWGSMYETLLEYVNDRKAVDGDWDGNVPANYKTNDAPPKALGRWINRQRTAHQKHKLKAEFADKLNSVGLKWSVHERRLVVPMSQLQTPIKNNLTVAQPPAAGYRSNPQGPIAAAAAAARLAAAKASGALPDAVKSNVITATATTKPNVTSIAATPVKIFVTKTSGTVAATPVKPAAIIFVTKTSDTAAATPSPVKSSATILAAHTSGIAAATAANPVTTSANAASSALTKPAAPVTQDPNAVETTKTISDAAATASDAVVTKTAANPATGTSPPAEAKHAIKIEEGTEPEMAVIASNAVPATITPPSDSPEADSEDLQSS